MKCTFYQNFSAKVIQFLKILFSYLAKKPLKRYPSQYGTFQVGRFHEFITFFPRRPSLSFRRRAQPQGDIRTFFTNSPLKIGQTKCKLRRCETLKKFTPKNVPKRAHANKSTCQKRAHFVWGSSVDVGGSAPSYSMWVSVMCNLHQFF